jgi:hypothetical protein
VIEATTTTAVPAAGSGQRNLQRRHPGDLRSVIEEFRRLGLVELFGDLAFYQTIVDVIAAHRGSSAAS